MSCSVLQMILDYFQTPNEIQYRKYKQTDKKWLK